jgi:putative tricarboxylic transport membrane protein
MPIAPVVLSIVGLSAVALAWTYGLWSFGSPGPGLMPTAAGVLLVCASAADFRRIAAPSWTFDRRLLAHAAALVLLPFASLVLGMLPALAAYVIVILHLVERLRLRNALAVAALAIVGCWLLFERLLSVPLPKPLWF